MAKPPIPPKPIRLTITVSPEVHAAFTRMAAASSLPVGRCMGEWLDDTIEGVEFVTAKLRDARDAPVRVIRELQAASRGLLGEIDSMGDAAVDQIRQRRAAGAVPAGTAGASPAAPSPRPVIRGVKSPGKARGGRS